MSRPRSGTRRDRSGHPGSTRHKASTNSLVDEIHEEIHAGLDEIRSTLLQELKELFNQRVDRMEQKMGHIEQQFNVLKSEIDRLNEKLSDSLQSQRNIERSNNQILEAIRSFQLIMVLSGTKNATESMKHEILTNIKSGSNESGTSNLLGT